MEENSIYCGDCLEVLKTFDSECVDLIYMYPPFFSGKNYDIIWDDGREIRGFRDSGWYFYECAKCGAKLQAIDIDYHEVNNCSKCGTTINKAKTKRKADIKAYIKWMKPRLIECHRVLKQTGSMYLHCDWHANAYLRVTMDKMFERNNFRNEIIWKRTVKVKGTARDYGHSTDTLLFYTKGKEFKFNKIFQPLSEDNIKRDYKNIEDESGRCFNHAGMFLPGDSPKKLIFKDRGEMVAPNGKRFRWSQETYDKKYMENSHCIYWTKSGQPRMKIYLDEHKGIPLGNIWTDIPEISTRSSECFDYPTQKPLALLERIIKASSNPGDIVLDPMCGCGTAIDAAHKLGRIYVGIDISPTSCELMKERTDSKKDIIGFPLTVEELQTMNPNEFQNWVNRKLNAKRREPDEGIDGITTLCKYPIQTKHYKQKSIETKIVREFIGAMELTNKKKGFIVGFKFSSGVAKVIDRAFKESGKEIIPLTIEDILKKTGNYNRDDFYHDLVTYM